jgi:GNAT superfamily N-acetyltransferase
MATESVPSSVIIRSYQQSDQSACQAIYTAAQLHEYDNPTFFVTYVLQTDMSDIEKNYLQIPNGHWWVAVLTFDNRIIGQVAVLPLHLADPSYYRQLPEEERDQTCKLLRMATVSDAQRQGIGKKLLSTLINFAREKGYHQVHLTTLANMNKACDFYEKNGFIKGQIDRFLLDTEPEKIEDIRTYFSSRPKPVIFEMGAIIPDEDQRLMKMPPIQSKFLYNQHFFLKL